MGRRMRRGPSSGRETSLASGRGNASWTEKKRDGATGKGRTQPAGVETWGRTRTTETSSSCMAVTAAKTSPRLFTRNTMSPTMIQSKVKTQRAFMTLYPQPDQPTKDTPQAPQASTCIRLSSCPLSGRGAYKQGSGGGRRRIAED